MNQETVVRQQGHPSHILIFPRSRASAKDRTELLIVRTKATNYRGLTIVDHDISVAVNGESPDLPEHVGEGRLLDSKTRIRRSLPQTRAANSHQEVRAPASNESRAVTACSFDTA